MEPCSQSADNHQPFGSVVDSHIPGECAATSRLDDWMPFTPLTTNLPPAVAANTLSPPTGPFDVLTASATIPPRLRTIRQEPRMPGGYNITAAVDPTKPTSQALPQVRITTHVATHHRNSVKRPAVAITTVAAKGTPVTQAGVRIVTEAGPNQQAVAQPGADTAHDATAAAYIQPTSHLESSAVAHQSEHRGTAEPQRAGDPQQP